MIPITETTEKLLRESAYQSVRIKVVLPNGEQIEDITSNDIVSGTFVLQRDSVCGELLEIGNMSSADLKFTLDNKKDDDGIGKFDSVKFNGANLFCTVIIIGEDGTENPIPLGVFTVDNQPRALETIEITAMDETVKLDREFQYTGMFPISLRELVITGLTKCSVQYDAADISIFPDETVVENFIAEVKQTLTWRQVIMWACQLICTCAYADGEGILRFRFYETNETEYLETEQGEAVCTERGQTIFLDFSNPTKKDFVLSESDRFADGSTFDEDDTVITGHQFKVGDMVYPPTVNTGYVLQTEDNLIFTCLSDENKDIYAEAVNQKLSGFSYRKFSAETHAYPHLLPLDRISYRKNEIYMSSIVTNHTFALNGSSKLSAKAKSKEDTGRSRPSAWTPQQSAIIGQINKDTFNIRSNLTTHEKATDYLNQTAASALGLYHKEVTDENGAVTYYWFDNVNIEDSQYICMRNAGGSFSTNTGWNNGNPDWSEGTDKYGNALCSLLNAIGIQAEWIRAESITTDKLSIGQSERGTNLIQDSSFESNSLCVRGTYDEESGTLTSPGHNDFWNKVSFSDSDAYDITYSEVMYAPSVGGFDGNKAILDVNSKGILEDEELWFTGVEQIEVIPIEMISHCISFYCRVKRQPSGYPQGTEIAHAKYAFKIQWLDVNQTPVGTTAQIFTVNSDGTENWQRLHAIVTPPNGTKYARFAIGFNCIDESTWVSDAETGKEGFADLAFLDLDGILFEQGTDLKAWTCSQAEVSNTGVLIDSNGLHIADGKIYITDPFGRKIFYLDGQQSLQLIGGLVTQIFDPESKKVYAQSEMQSVNDAHVWDESGSLAGSGFLGQTFKKADENGQLQTLGSIGMKFSNDPHTNNDYPLSFYSQNGFAFNGSRAALISAPVEISEATVYLAELQTPGWYICTTDERAAELTQCPVTKAFTIQVCKFGSYVLQYLVARDGETHQRVFDVTAEVIPGDNWYSLTGREVSSMYNSTTLGDFPPGIYIQSEDITSSALVQSSTDTKAYAFKYPAVDSGIFEVFWGTNGIKFHRYTSRRGEVWCRNYTPQYGWAFWRKNNVKT